MLEFLQRSTEGVNFFQGSHPQNPTAFPAKEPPFSHLLKSKSVTASAYSKDGSLLAWVADGMLIVVDVQKGNCLLNVVQPAEEILFSPKNTFVAVWHKGHFSQSSSSSLKDASLTKDVRLLNSNEKLETQRVIFQSPEATQKEAETQEMIKSNTSRENLVIYNLQTQKIEASFFQREKEDWKPQWSENDEICLRMTTNTLIIYKNTNFSQSNAQVITIEGVEAAILYPKAPYKIATFVPVKKDAPAVVNLFALNSPTSSIVSKSFFKAKETALSWNFDGSAVLSLCNFNGEYSLYYISVNLSTRVILDKYGTINYACFNPVNRQFFVIYGGATRLAVFDQECKVVASFEESNFRKELTKFSPNGKLLSVCQVTPEKLKVEIFDIKLKSQQSNNSGGSSSKAGGFVTRVETTKQLSFIEWAPDSQYFLVGSHHPLVQRDNGMSVFDLHSKSLYAAKFEHLYQISWRPVASESSDSSGGSSASEDEKRLKNLRKKLKAVEELKEKKDLGLELEENQFAKLAIEEALRKEIEVLSLKVQQEQS